MRTPPAFSLPKLLGDSARSGRRLQRHVPGIGHRSQGYGQDSNSFPSSTWILLFYPCLFNYLFNYFNGGVDKAAKGEVGKPTSQGDFYQTCSRYPLCPKNTSAATFPQGHGLVFPRDGWARPHPHPKHGSQGKHGIREILEAGKALQDQQFQQCVNPAVSLSSFSKPSFPDTLPGFSQPPHGILTSSCRGFSFSIRAQTSREIQTPPCTFLLHPAGICFLGFPSLWRSWIHNHFPLLMVPLGLG